VGLAGLPAPLDECSALANRCTRRDKGMPCLYSPTTALFFVGSAFRFGVICLWFLFFGFLPIQPKDGINTPPSCELNS